MFKNNFQFWWVAISLCLVTFLIRSPFTGFSSIIDNVQNDLHFNANLKGILISLPTFIIAIFSAFIDKLDEKIGVVYSLLLAILLILFGLFFRDLISAYGFTIPLILLGTVLLSIGITIMSVLYPAFINAFFYKQMGVMSSINATNLSISALAGTFFALFMVSNGYSWREACLLWLLLSVIILIVYLPVISFTKDRMQQVMTENKTAKVQAHLAGERTPSMWKQIAPWGLAIALGIEGADFYFAFTWYPSLAKDFITTDQLNFLITEYQFLSLPLSFLAPIILVRYKKHINIILFLFALIFGLSSVALLFTIQSSMVVLTVVFAIFGSTSGLLISAYMTLLSTKTTRSISTAKLSAMVQCVGFLTTSLILYLYGFGNQYIGGNFVIWFTIGFNLLIPFLTLIATHYPIKEKPIKISKDLSSIR